MTETTTTESEGSDTEGLPQPFQQLIEAAGKAEERRDKEKVHCPQCDTTVWKDTVHEAVETAEQHEESRHDGEPTVEVNGLVLPSFSEEEKEQIRDSVRSLRTDT